MNDPTERQREDTNATFRRLRALQRRFGAKPNKHDLADALIGACITEGMDTRTRIAGALMKLGLNEAHVAQVLATRTGPNPAVHLWTVDADGRYQLL